MQLNESSTPSESSALVIGNRWAALLCVANLVFIQKKVDWVMPPTGKSFPLLPELGWSELECEPALAQWHHIFMEFGVLSNDESTDGYFLREYKNKSFRIPKWNEPLPENEKNEERELTLFGPEKRECPFTERKFEKPFWECVQELMVVLMNHPLVQVKQDVLISKIDENKLDKMFHVHFSDQTTVSYAELFCADDILQIKNFFSFFHSVTLHGKKITLPQLLRKWDLGGMLQVEFLHSVLPDQKMDCGFLIPITRESYEKQTRHVLGYMIHSEKKSRWTVFLTSEEQEENQEIAKKLRRLKQAIHKAFTVQEFYSSMSFKEGTGWMETIEKENVALLASSVSFSEKATSDFLQVPHKNVFMVQDFFGPLVSMKSVQNLWGHLGWSAPTSTVTQSEHPNTLGVELSP